MEYALLLLVCLGGFTFLGVWLQEQFGFSNLWVVLFAIAGAALGIVAMAMKGQQQFREHQEYLEHKKEDEEQEAKSNEPKP